MTHIAAIVCGNSERKHKHPQKALNGCGNWKYFNNLGIALIPKHWRMVCMNLTVCLHFSFNILHYIFQQM